MVKTVAGVAAGCGGKVRAVSFSSAMHTLIGLDRHGSPLTPVVTWADMRASAQAERMRAAPGGLALHRRTGTPLHPMAPLPKLAWFHEEQPDLAAQVQHWVGIKDYVLLELLGVLATDHSTASGTGLLDIHALQWDPEALHLAAISAGQLPELVPTTKVLPGLRPKLPRPCSFRPQRPSSRARATARWPTWAWERSGPAWQPAPSAPAGHCGSQSSVPSSTLGDGLSVTP